MVSRIFSRQGLMSFNLFFSHKETPFYQDFLNCIQYTPNVKTFLVMHSELSHLTACLLGVP